MQNFGGVEQDISFQELFQEKIRVSGGKKPSESVSGSALFHFTVFEYRYKLCSSTLFEGLHAAPRVISASRLRISEIREAASLREDRFRVASFLCRSSKHQKFPPELLSLSLSLSPPLSVIFTGSFSPPLNFHSRCVTEYARVNVRRSLSRRVRNTAVVNLATTPAYSLVHSTCKPRYVSYECNHPFPPTSFFFSPFTRIIERDRSEEDEDTRCLKGRREVDAAARGCAHNELDIRKDIALPSYFVCQMESGARRYCLPLAISSTFFPDVSRLLESRSRPARVYLTIPLPAAPPSAANGRVYRSINRK